MHTFGHMFFGFVGGVLLNLSYVSWMNGHGWEWAYGFPLGWGGAGLGAMVTFFHEIGHSLPAWFYGYVTLPSFDLTYGGGMAWMMTGQIIPLALMLNAMLLYAAYYFRGHRWLMLLLGGYALFTLATLLTEYHEAVINLAGPAAEVLFAAFFLFRAWLDLAPRGEAERFLNALIGWGMILHAALTGFGLLGNAAMRESYYNQKGAHGFGDFDKIADMLSVPFSGVVLCWLALIALGAIIPIIVWTVRDGRDGGE